MYPPIPLDARLVSDRQDLINDANLAQQTVDRGNVSRQIYNLTRHIN